MSRAPARNIEITIEQDEDLRERYLHSPNALHRGECDDRLGVDYSKMTMRARCMLAALLTMSSGHKLGRAQVKEIAWELGEDTLDAVLWELRSRGHLRVRQIHGSGGMFSYHWAVSWKGRKDWAEEESAERSARSGRGRRAAAAAISAGQTMGVQTGHGVDPDNSPPSPNPPSPNLGEPQVGEGGVKRTSKGPPSKKDQEDQNLPPALQDDHPLHAKADLESGGEHPPSGQDEPDGGVQNLHPTADQEEPAQPESGNPLLDELVRDRLNDAVASAVEIRAGDVAWSAGRVRVALRAALDAGHDPVGAARALLVLAGDRSGTRFPARLLPYLDTAVAKAAAAGADVDVERVPVRVRQPGMPACRTHPGEPAHACPGCAGDGLAPRDVPAEVLDGETARRLIREATGNRGVTKQRSTPGERPTEGLVDQLAS